MAAIKMQRRSPPARQRLELTVDIPRRFQRNHPMPVVSNEHARVIEFPRCGDVVAAAAIVIRIFSAYGIVRLNVDGLRSSGVTLDENFVDAMSRR